MDKWTPSYRGVTTGNNLERWCYALATCLGIGRAKLAPGTLASLAALPGHWLLEYLALPLHVLLLLIIAFVAFFAAGTVCRLQREDDPQIIVVDELIGTLVALCIVGPLGVPAEFAALLLFRILDIVKPWPIGLLERFGPPGFRVVADDLAAGAASGVIIALAWTV